MRILGVDPGLTRCGIGVIDSDNRSRATFVHVTVLKTESDLDLADRLGALKIQMERVFDEFNPEVVAVERVFSQLNVRTAMGTAQASAVALLIAHARALPVFMYTPTEVKAAVTGSGKADKKQVTQMVTRHLRLEQFPKPADAADALALALCHSWRGAGQERLATAARRYGVAL